MLFSCPITSHMCRRRSVHVQSCKSLEHRHCDRSSPAAMFAFATGTSATKSILVTNQSLRYNAWVSTVVRGAVPWTCRLPSSKRMQSYSTCIVPSNFKNKTGTHHHSAASTQHRPRAVFMDIAQTHSAARGRGASKAQSKRTQQLSSGHATHGLTKMAAIKAVGRTHTQDEGRRARTQNRNQSGLT